MKEKKKFGVLILFFDCEQFILRTIENCAPHIDKIYISFSTQPWSAYNTKAPNLFTNNSNLNILKKSKYFEKLEIVSGVWETEEAQRNACRTKAIDDGMDYLIVQDADEFYLPSDYQRNLKQIELNPDYEVYQCPWMIFWKDTNHVILHREHLGQKNVLQTTCPMYAINLKVNNPFYSRRLPQRMNSIFRLDGLCFHLSYVFTDEEMYRKINTWGHASQVKKEWFAWKWLAWNETTKYLNPQNPTEWISAVKFTGELPLEIKDFPNPVQTYMELSQLDQLKCYIYDSLNIVFMNGRRVLIKFKEKFKR